MSADDHGGADSAVISLAAGARVAGYRLEQRVGQGGTAVVFRAHDERLGRTVALKVLAPALAGDEESRRRFLRESRAAAAVDDPHIVPVYGADEADGVLFIAMRYIAGGDARSLLKREGPLPPERAAAIVSPVASALDAAHRAGLVHRDVKPSNMLLDVLPGRPAHVYLSDFGLSKPATATSGLTAAGSIRGTLAYMSPEQVRSQPADGRADQYALACSAYELLTGAPPFQRDDPAALMYAHLSEAPPPLTARRPGLPPAADSVIAKALAKVPGDRYDTCGDFADALRRALGLPPYRSGSGGTPAGKRPVAGAEKHPPTEDAWPEPREDAQRAGPGAGEAPVPPSAPAAPHAGRRPGPIAEDAASPNAAAAPDVRRLDAGGSHAQLRRLRRRIAVVAGIVAAAGLALGLLLVPAHPAAPAATVAIAVKSGFPAVTGDVYVLYKGGKNANAEISGEVAAAANGEVAALYAQQFPYTSTPAKVGSVALHPAGGTARYQFQVTPTLATRYQVELFKSGTTSAPLAVSDDKTVYVAANENTSPPQKCDGPVCYESATAVFAAPPAALKSEMAKTPQVYFGLNQSKTKKKVPAPQWVSLGAGHALVVGTELIAADEFLVTVTFSFTIGSDYRHVAWDMAYAVCIKDTEATNGIGLPGNHGCGDQRLPSSGSYYPGGYIG